ncbi:MAG: UxaA family hydrolase, partial [Planctomycetes bacterium]|nr:UxaA family hydrolase [Planctomycetota bacterium]
MHQVKTSNRPRVIQLRPEDNIALAAGRLEPGAEVVANGYAVSVQEAIGLGHKVALRRIAKGEPIRKYGQIIGFASGEITPGSWVHTHNVELGEFQRDYAFASAVPETPRPAEPRTFMGYPRAGGKVGTRNYICIISMVNCSASTSKYIAQRFDHSLLKDYPNVDGVFAITHKGGCGLQYGGPDHEQLDRVLAGFARHPNVGA